ncbi:MAG: hydroxylamine reductase [Candidatus Omnitrophota bacterium]
MSMFCYQCQETMKNTGCTINGACGKKEDVANLQDLLVYTLKGISICAEEADLKGEALKPYGLFICGALFATITNANFDKDRIAGLIKEALNIREEIKAGLKASGFSGGTHDSVVWNAGSITAMEEKAGGVGVLSTRDEDVRSLRELLVYGLKGLSAYTSHAAILGFEDPEIYEFVVMALASTTREMSAEEMTGLVVKAGETAVKAMALLDKANTSIYGNPEITKVNIGVRNTPGILISGHDLKDMEILLKQTDGKGVDVYSHSEMLPANYYPAFKKYGHFAGNYGGSWWKQNSEFESFNGPILMTTNCITPVKDTYKNRIFTTGMAGYPGVEHIPEGTGGKEKDFSVIIELARKCKSPEQIETGYITGGFAHHQVMALADKVVAAVKTGKIKRFIVMAGCDGRHKDREYFTDVARALPDNTVILTAGCAKYRYNKLELGDIDGIPRVLDAGQCNDSYSLAVIALKLKEVFGLSDVNELPISFDIAWYEQKAVAVLLALLYLGFKGIMLGPTLPAFLSPGVAKVLADRFGIKLTGKAEEDVDRMMG